MAAAKKYVTCQYRTEDKEEAHRELKDLSPLQASNWNDGVPSINES